MICWRLCRQSSRPTASAEMGSPCAVKWQLHRVGPTMPLQREGLYILARRVCHRGILPTRALVMTKGTADWKLEHLIDSLENNLRIKKTWSLQAKLFPHRWQSGALLTLTSGKISYFRTPTLKGKAIRSLSNLYGTCGDSIYEMRRSEMKPSNLTLQQFPSYFLSSSSVVSAVHSRCL